MSQKNNLSSHKKKKKTFYNNQNKHMSFKLLYHSGKKQNKTKQQNLCLTFKFAACQMDL